MKNSELLALSFVAASLAFAAGAQTKPAAPMQPGLWETTLVIESPGANAKRTVVGRACFTAADVATPARIAPRQREQGMSCENRDLKAEGANLQWRIACTAADSTLAGSGELALAATTYAGHAEVDRKKRGAKAEKVAETFAGKRLGACP